MYFILLSIDTCSNRSTLDNWQIQLQVKCVQSECEISVYIKAENIAYPLGLLPGSVVYLEHIERRVSRKGIVYCQYSVVSSITVLHYHRVSSDKVTDRCVSNLIKIKPFTCSPLLTFRGIGVLR